MSDRGVQDVRGLYLFLQIGNKSFQKDSDSTNHDLFLQPDVLLSYRAILIWADIFSFDYLSTPFAMWIVNKKIFHNDIIYLPGLPGHSQ